MINCIKNQVTSNRDPVPRLYSINNHAYNGVNIQGYLALRVQDINLEQRKILPEPVS